MNFRIFKNFDQNQILVKKQLCVKSLLILKFGKKRTKFGNEKTKLGSPKKFGYKKRYLGPRKFWEEKALIWVEKNLLAAFCCFFPFLHHEVAYHEVTARSDLHEVTYHEVTKAK